VITFKNIGYFGRLGNQMFQYASLVGMAKSRGIEYGIPYSNSATEILVNANTGPEKLELPRAFCGLDAKNVKRDGSQSLYYDRACEYNADLVRDLPDNIDILGYFQSEKYFKHCEKEIREQYEFRKHIKDSSETKLNTLALHHKPVSVHIRRSDYLNYQGIHDFPGKEYYTEAMTKFKDCSFLFFSDDIEWCKQEFPEHYYSNGVDQIEDLCMMSMCHGHIIANSSFSWWGAWLSKHDDVIAPSKWFGPSGQDSWQDIYCDGWRVI